MKDSERFQQTLNEIREAGLYKQERVITTPQGVAIRVQGGREVLNFCANNYLGLADHPEVIAAAHRALDDHGFGLASVRFICGTQDLHKELEAAISRFFGTDDTILYTSCFDANGGLFETLLGPEDAVISDALNHASIIDGIRLCKAQRYRYANNDMADLEAKLKEARAVQGVRVAESTLGLERNHKVFASTEGSYIDWLTISDNARSVVEDVTRIRRHPLVPKEIPIFGYIYDVKTGKLLEVPQATEAGRAG